MSVQSRENGVLLACPQVVGALVRKQDWPRGFARFVNGVPHPFFSPGFQVEGVDRQVGMVKSALGVGAQWLDNGTSGKLQGPRSCPLRNSRCLVTRLTEAAEILHPPRVPRLVTKPTRTVLHHDGCAQFCSHLSQRFGSSRGESR
jgi:hypothetical protein